MHTVVHNAASLDGRIDSFAPDIGLYYELAGTWDADAHLTGADTLVEGADFEASESAPDAPSPESLVSDEAAEDDGDDGEEGPLLVVTDSEGRVTEWDQIRDQPHWRDVLVLCSKTTPEEYLSELVRAEVSFLVVGEERVDVRDAFDALADRGVETILVDSGGSLSGALFAAGLVDEVSVLVHPSVVGGTSARSFVRGPDPVNGPTALDLLAVEEPAEDIVWLRYTVVG